MVLVSALWRDATSQPMGGKRIVHVSTPRAKTNNSDFSLPNIGSSCAEVGCMGFANAAIRSGVSVFPSQPAPAVSLYLGPVNSSTFAKRLPTPPLSATPRNLFDASLRRLISTPRSRFGTPRSDRSFRPSTSPQSARSPAVADTCFDSASTVDLPKPRSTPRPPRYFPEGTTNGYESIGSATSRGAKGGCPQRQRDAEFDFAFLSEGRCRSDIEEFELKKMRGIGSR